MKGPERWIPWCARGGAFVTLLLIYLLTMAPTLTWAHYGADGGDLITAVARRSIPHPPGFPTYLLLGEFFIRLSWRDPAWRMNLMSAVMAAAAASMAGGRKQEAGSLPLASCLLPLAPCLLPLASCLLPLASCLLPLAPCLLLGLAPLFWSQALITEVYTTAAFFTALILLLAQRTGSGVTCAIGLLWGMGIGAHPTLLFLLPLVIRPAVGADGRTTGRRFILLTLSTLLGCGIMYGPWLLARSGATSPWGDVSTPAGWWALVSGRLYHRYAFRLPLAAWPRRLLVWLGLLARQFTPLGALLAGWGWVRLWRRERALAAGSALAFGAFSLHAIGYNTPDSLVHLVPALPLAALWLGEGLGQAVGWLERRRPGAAAVLLLLPLLQAVLFWRQMDVSGDRRALEWAGQTLRRMPDRAVALTDRDQETFALWYVHDVLGERPDVTVIDVDLWEQETYRRAMAGQLGIPDDGELAPEEAARRVGRPAVVVE